eukprot:GFKZ01001511.1.p1 GENE.GFKZ01001511.1~~GFKZ01001511.1.p1  ORF type:complete len:110 (+),score=5.57 GFKZ01001511.1:112-441(+)
MSTPTPPLPSLSQSQPCPPVHHLLATRPNSPLPPQFPPISFLELVSDILGQFNDARSTHMRRDMLHRFLALAKLVLRKNDRSEPRNRNRPGVRASTAHRISLAKQGKWR